MFNPGDDYILMYGHAEGPLRNTTLTYTTLVGKIVNSYEEEPGLWVVIIREPQTGTLLKRLRTVKTPTKLATNGGF